MPTRNEYTDPAKQVRDDEMDKELKKIIEFYDK